MLSPSLQLPSCKALHNRCDVISTYREIATLAHEVGNNAMEAGTLVMQCLSTNKNIMPQERNILITCCWFLSRQCTSSGSSPHYSIMLYRQINIYQYVLGVISLARTISIRPTGLLSTEISKKTFGLFSAKFLAHGGITTLSSPRVGGLADDEPNPIYTDARIIKIRWDFDDLTIPHHQTSNIKQSNRQTDKIW